MAKTKVLYETEEDQIKFLRKRGNIITFKEPFYPRGTTDESRSQIIVQRLAKDRSGAVKIEGQFFDTPWFKSTSELLAAVDWTWMRNAHRDLPKRETRRKGYGI